MNTWVIITIVVLTYLLLMQALAGYRDIRMAQATPVATKSASCRCSAVQSAD